MEHNKHEIAAIADEALEDVSGGVLGINEFSCSICKETYAIALRIVYNNRYICRFCKKKLDDQSIRI